MKAIKKYMALAAVLAVIALGCIMLMVDYDTIMAAWLGLIGAAVFFVCGILLGRWLERKNMLPQ